MHEMQNDIEAGRHVTSRQVPAEHLECPVPKPSFGSLDEIPPTDQ